MYIGRIFNELSYTEILKKEISHIESKEIIQVNLFTKQMQSKT